MHYYNESKWKKKLDPGLFVQTQLYGYLSFKWNTCCFLPVSFWTFLLFFLQKFFVGASKHSIAPLSHLLNSSVKAASFQLRINGQKFVLTNYKPLSGRNKQILISTKIQFKLIFKNFIAWQSYFWVFHNKPWIMSAYIFEITKSGI